MARIPQARLDRLKTQVSLVRLIEDAGMALKRQSPQWRITPFALSRKTRKSRDESTIRFGVFPAPAFRGAPVGRLIRPTSNSRDLISAPPAPCL